MDKFRKRLITKNDIPDNDLGVYVQDVLSLIQGHKYYDDFLTYLDVEAIKYDFIQIPGAQRLVTALKGISEKFVKFDLESDYRDLDFQYNPDDSKLKINYSDITRVSFVNSSQMFDMKMFEAIPINSAQGDFFGGLYNMSKYASSLLSTGNADVVLQNLEILRDVFKTERHVKSYRIIKDDGDYHLRAITSTQYADFNLNISVAIMLITLHKNASTHSAYNLGRCEYSQSSLKVYFEKNVIQDLDGVGKIKYLMELSNDEIKEDPLKVSLGFSLIYKNENDNDTEIYIKPQDYKSTIISISHRGNPKSAVKQLENIKTLDEMEKDLLEDLILIRKIKDHNQIKHLLKTRVEKLKANPLIQHKKEILKVCEDTVHNMHELLILFHKVDLIAEDIESKEFLRYLMYDVLTKKTK